VIWGIGVHGRLGDLQIGSVSQIPQPYRLRTISLDVDSELYDHLNPHYSDDSFTWIANAISNSRRIRQSRPVLMILDCDGLHKEEKLRKNAREGGKRRARRTIGLDVEITKSSEEEYCGCPMTQGRRPRQV